MTINIWMQKYVAVVRVSGINVRTCVFADSPVHARLILEYQFGIGNVVHSPTISEKTNDNFLIFNEINSTNQPIKPLKPEQLRIEFLKKQKQVAAKNLKSERERQQLAKFKKSQAVT